MSHEGNAGEVQDRKSILLDAFNNYEPDNSGADRTEAGDAAVSAPQGDKPAASPAPAAVPAAVAGPVRDDQGRFSAKEKAQGSLPAAPGVGAAMPVPAPTPTLNAWDKAPGTWKTAKHSVWAGMSPEAREYVYQREEESRAGIAPLRASADLGEAINRVAQPYIQTIQGLGLDLPRAVEGLMRVDNQLRTLPHEQKMQLLQNVAMSYGVDLSGQLANAQEAYPPAVQHMQNELMQMRGQLASFQQQQEQAQINSANEEIRRFAQQAEHYEDVRPMMAQLLQSGVADGLEDAYEKSIRLSPDLFDKRQTAQQAATDAGKRAAADAAAKQARAAAVSPKSASGASRANGAQDRRSMLREQLDSMSDRL